MNQDEIDRAAAAMPTRAELAKRYQMRLFWLVMLVVLVFVLAAVSWLVAWEAAPP